MILIISYDNVFYWYLIFWFHGLWSFIFKTLSLTFLASWLNHLPLRWTNGWDNDDDKKEKEEEEFNETIACFKVQKFFLLLCPLSWGMWILKILSIEIQLLLLYPQVWGEHVVARCDTMQWNSRVSLFSTLGPIVYPKLFPFFMFSHPETSFPHLISKAILISSDSWLYLFPFFSLSQLTQNSNL